jgi:hypothetical protein
MAYNYAAKTPSAAPYGADANSDPLTQEREWPWVGASGGRLAQGLFFGVIFGFLLQKGGVAKFDILVGALLLENFVVVKVMVSAIVVGMIGVQLLRHAGLLEKQIKSANLGANVIGGLLFGAGFGLIAYCPGTNATAVGQGNFDALVGVIGLALGSYVYALTSGGLSRTVSTWGRLGKLTLSRLVGISSDAFVALAVPVLVGVLVLLEVFFKN